MTDASRTGAPILSVRRLTIDHPLPATWPWMAPAALRAVDDVHFNVHRGQTLGIVGDSGCGKSTLARALVGLKPVTTGGIVLEGRDLARLDETQWQPLRRHIQMVFQDPRASLDPLMTILDSVLEPLENLCPELDAAASRERAVAMLERAGVPGALHDRYPHELTDGQCQRVGIARALVVAPRVLICDEPVAALDGPEQDDVLDLLADLQREQGMAMVLISRDLAVVRRACHRVLVMYLGKVMEQAACPTLFEEPRHPYTRALLGVPRAEPVGEDVAPSLADPPSGCVYRTRCPMADDLCAREVPYLRRVGPQSHAACHYLQDADQRPLGFVGRARPLLPPESPSE